MLREMNHNANLLLRLIFEHFILQNIYEAKVKLI